MITIEYEAEPMIIRSVREYQHTKTSKSLASHEGWK